MAQIVKDSEGNVYDVEGSGRRDLAGRHKLNWGAIVGGVVFLLGLGTLLLWLGSALGVTLFSSYDVAAGDRSIPWATLGWLAFTVLACSFFGAWLASRWANLWNSSDAAMHGVITWSLAVILLSMGLTGLADTAASAYNTAQSAPQQSSALQSQSGSAQQSMPMYSSLQDEQFTNFVLNRAKSAQPSPDARRDQEPVNVTADQNAQSVNTSDQSGSEKAKDSAMGKEGEIENRDELASYVSRSTNMSKDQAEKFLDQNKAEIAQAQSQSQQRWAQAHSRELAQAENAREAMSALGWSMFGLLLLSLAASLGGAYFGYHQYRKNDLGEPDETSTTSTATTPDSTI
jgi:hypothetical protein